MPKLATGGVCLIGIAVMLFTNTLLLYAIILDTVVCITVIYIMARDYDGKVTPEEVASAATYLKDTLDKEGIQELIGKLSKDRGQLCNLFSPICPQLTPLFDKSL